MVEALVWPQQLHYKKAAAGLGIDRKPASTAVEWQAVPPDGSRCGIRAVENARYYGARAETELR
jgi:hypothetical protein